MMVDGKNEKEGLREERGGRLGRGQKKDNYKSGIAKSH